MLAREAAHFTKRYLPKPRGGVGVVHAIFIFAADCGSKRIQKGTARVADREQLEDEHADWRQRPVYHEPERSTPQPCLSDPTQPRSAPNAGTEEMRLSIQNDIDHGNIVEGDEQKINGVTCRMWKVTALSEKGRMGSYSTCIGELDHSPAHDG